jgi:porin
MCPNSYGLYWHADQTVYRVDPISDKGLVLWSAYVLSPQENTSKLPFQADGGAIYTGLIPGRENDATLLGFVYGDFSSSYAAKQLTNGRGNPNYELAYEAGYRINFTKFAYFQPDLQWIIHPGGLTATPNALVLGAQMGLVF